MTPLLAVALVPLVSGLTAAPASLGPRPEPLAFAAAQDEAGWSFTLKPYLWGAGLDGDVGIGNAEVDVDVGFDDLLDHLDVGAMIGFEARPADASWALVFDLIYMELGDDLDRADVDVTELVAEVDVAFALEGWESTEILAGLRYWDLETDLELGPIDRGREEDWVDPVLGLRGLEELGESWSLDWRADIGGFGVGSDFSYQIFAAFTRPIGDSTRFGLGWRHLAVDYDDDGFTYDTQTSGPILGLTWGF